MGASHLDRLVDEDTLLPPIPAKVERLSGSSKHGLPGRTTLLSAKNVGIPDEIEAPRARRSSERGASSSDRTPLRITRFALAPHGQNEHNIQLSHVSVEGHVAAGESANDQLPQVLGRRPANQRIVFQNVDRLDDVFEAPLRIRYFILLEMGKNAIEIISDLFGQFDTRHPSTGQSAGHRTLDRPTGKTRF